MSRRLALAERGPADAGAEALRVLAVALVPYMREFLAAENRGGELVDVLATVPAPRRTVTRACRTGAIAGAAKVGRRWLAARKDIDVWLRSIGPRPLTKPNDGEDELEPLRRFLARGCR